MDYDRGVCGIFSFYIFLGSDDYPVLIEYSRADRGKSSVSRDGGLHNLDREYLAKLDASIAHVK